MTSGSAMPRGSGRPQGGAGGSGRTIAVTGATGMLGWHLRCRAFAAGVSTVPVGRAELADPDRLADILTAASAVVHCAGANRGEESEVVEGNLAAARGLAEGLRRAGRDLRVVYANSVHRATDSGYGIAKRKAAELLAGAAPGRFSDVVLPHLFGEHARPHHNSFVATFAYELAQGRRPEQVRDRELALLHAQEAAGVLLSEVDTAGDRVVEPAGEPMSVAGVLSTLEHFAAIYRSGDLPDLTGRTSGLPESSDRVRVNLFHTYRSYLFPERFPIPLPRRSDQRGTLVECVRTGFAGGQGFVSSTVPSAVRGEHMHLRKFERYVVVSGTAEIALRRLFTRQVVRFSVTGEEPVIVDMPTGWAHHLINVGAQPLTTFFWSNEVYRPEDPDTYPCPVVPAAAGSEGS